MRIEKVEAYPVRVPIKPLTEGGVAPYRGSREAMGTSWVTGVIYKLTTEEGLVGWGEMNLIYSLDITMCIVKEIFQAAYGRLCGVVRRMPQWLTWSRWEE